MNLLDLMVKIGVDDDASRKIDGIAGNIKNGLTRAAKAGAIAIGAGVTAAAAGVVAIGKQAFDAYASYEQLAGGVEKMFGSAADTVMENAQKAYMTAGLSANEYMDQTMRFSAALIQSLGGNYEEAAHLADEAMMAMSDNVNVFGTDMVDVQNAFQGFAKQNYSMLDNLRLGYGQGKEEMQRLIADAAACTEAQEALGLSVDANSMSFDNIVKAIQVVQYEQGIWGTTAEEASKTVQGSITMTQAAWENFLTELGKPIDEADLSARLEELIESATTVVENVTPVIERITAALIEHAPEIAAGAMAIGAAILQGIIDGIVQALPGLPDFMQSDVVQGLADAWSPVIDKLREIGDTLAPYVQPALEHLWQVMQDSLIPALERLGEACAYFFEQLEPYAPYIMYTLVAALDLLIFTLSAIIDIIAAVINIVGTIIQVMSAFVDALQHPKRTLDELGRAMLGIVGVMSRDLQTALQNLVQVLLGMGGNLIMGLVTGIRERGGMIADVFLGFLDEMVAAVKGFLGIASPSTVFQGIGGDIIAGLYNGLVSMWYSVTGFIYSIPGNILAALGNMGNLLYNAGWNVLMGFYNGAVAAWNTMTGWLSSIGGWIQNLKGPLDYDRKLLIKNGMAIMQGLDEGLKSGYEDVVDTVSGMGLGISASMDVNPQGAQVGGITGEIASLREELRQMRLVLNIDGRAFAEATVGEMDRAMGNMARRAVAR